MEEYDQVEKIVAMSGQGAGVIVGMFVLKKIYSLEKEISEKFTAMREAVSSEFAKIRDEFSKVREELIDLKHKTGRVSDLEVKVKDLESWRSKTSIRLVRIAEAVNRALRHAHANKAQVSELQGIPQITEDFIDDG